VAFGKKWDPEGHYIRKYVPELKDMPKKFIYEPHKAPIADQKKAGVRIEGDSDQGEKDGLKSYPKPMFDFATQRDICLEGMKGAYHVDLYGNDPKVMDGSWKALFDDNAEGPTQGKQGGPGGLDSLEDADGADEGTSHRKPQTPKKATRSGSSGSPRATRGHKREASQGTLDGAFKKKAAKKEAK
jgi:cryptochrome